MRGALLLASALLGGCWSSHAADVIAPKVEPPVGLVRHTGRLWIELEPLTADRQCVLPSGEPRVSADPAAAADDASSAARPVCFDGMRDALATALGSALWPSFPRVGVRGRSDDLRPGDWVLLIDADISVAPPDEHGAGWAAGLLGSWRLIRDGLPVESGTIRERSRGDFAYGRQLAVGASEAIRAAVVRMASSVASVSDERPSAPPRGAAVARQ
jgi:hypothetical protein